MKHLEQLSLAESKVLVRVDFNVPLKEGKVADDTRIQAALPTLQYILDQGASIILLSHLGRPQKDKNEDGSLKRDQFSLKAVADYLGTLVDASVHFCPENTGAIAREAVAQLEQGQILILENTRFQEGEKKGDEALAEEWASYADFYVNDAFGAAHRAHASTCTVANFFDGQHKAAGYLLHKEVSEGQKVLFDAQRPLLAIVGGAKVSDKILLLEQMVEKADMIIIGGGMAYTFIKAKGGAIGNSLVEEDKLDLALKILQKAIAEHTEIYLPVDSVVADEFAATAKTQNTASDQIPDGWMGLDIGPKAVQDFSKAIAKAKTIIWNGPMGVFEFDAFNKGTFAMAKAIAEATQNGAYSLVGGGDSANAVNQSGLAASISHISTGGGAMLELLEGKTLPGIKALED